MADKLKELFSRLKSAPRDPELHLAIAKEMAWLGYERTLEFAVRAAQLDLSLVQETKHLIPDAILQEIEEHRDAAGRSFFELAAGRFYRKDLDGAFHLYELQSNIVPAKYAPRTLYAMGLILETKGHTKAAKECFLRSYQAGFKKASEHFSKEDLESLAEKGAEHYDALFREKEFSSSREDLLKAAVELISRYAAENGSKYLLDIGCGTGLFGQLVMEATDLDYAGYDLSSVAVEQAKKRNPGNIDRFFVGSAYNPRIYHGAHIVTAFEVLEHVDDRKILDNLPPDSLLVASVPNFGDVAHLRTYDQDMIRERYGEVLVLDPEIQTFSQRMGKKNLEWYLFSGTKTADAGEDHGA